MPFPANSGNRKIDELFTPMKKNRQNATATATKTANAATSDERKIPGTDQFISPKRRRRLQLEKQEELAELFDKISDDPFYENEMPSFSNDSPTIEQDLDNNPPFATADQQIDWLYGGTSSGGDAHADTTMSTADDLARMANTFLEDELTEQLKQALASTDLHDDGVISYQFFSERCKLPNPSLQQENMGMLDKPTRRKYDHIINYSQLEDERNFLLSSDQLPLWHRLGWQCPHSVFQWLIEVVAFDKNIETARSAMSIVFTLWFDVFRKKIPLSPLAADGINYDRNMSVETFSYIMASYGALNLSTTDFDMNTTTASQQMNGDNMVMTEEETTGDDRIPLIQFEWVLDLLKTSLTLWPDAYTVSQLQYMANTLVCLGMDGIGVLVVKHIQDALEASLRAFPGDDLDWKTQVQQLAFTLCEQQFNSIRLQVRLPTTAKPTCDRCQYLRRVIALTALELALKMDQQERTATAVGDGGSAGGSGGLVEAATHSTKASSQVTLESISLFLASNGDDLLPRLATMVNDPDSIFQQTEPYYRDYSDRICLLDFAIGNNYTEFMTSIDATHSLVTQLQASSRKIGGRLGTLERTKANEVTQRLWSRLAYVIGRNGNTVKDIEF